MEGKRYKPLREYYKSIKGLNDKTEYVIRARAKNLSGFGEYGPVEVSKLTFFVRCVVCVQRGGKCACFFSLSVYFFTLFASCTLNFVACFFSSIESHPLLGTGDVCCGECALYP